MFFIIVNIRKSWSCLNGSLGLEGTNELSLEKKMYIYNTIKKQIENLFPELEQGRGV